MNQMDMFSAPATETEPLKHENLYLSAAAKKKLVHLKKINKDKITKRIRRAAEEAIEAEWRAVCKISGQEPDLGF